MIQRLKLYFGRLVPAAAMTAIFAGVAHAALVAVAARMVGLETVAIAALTFGVALVVALAGGMLLLAIVAMLRLGLIQSLILFFVSVQLIVIWLEFFFFEFQNGWADISWQYGLISVPASLIAWHQSIYAVYKSV